MANSSGCLADCVGSLPKSSGFSMAQWDASAVKNTENAHESAACSVLVQKQVLSGSNFILQPELFSLLCYFPPER